MAEGIVTRGRIVVALVAMAVIVVAALLWVFTMPSSEDGLSMGDYGQKKQSEWAERLVAGLNTHDVNQVPLLRTNGVLSAEQRTTIEAFLPESNCEYRLTAVDDRGQQGRQKVPGLSAESSTYRFDMSVEETCLNQSPRSRTVGVVAIPEMSYWEPFYFAP